MPQYDFLQPEATKEFRETEKAMSKPEYPQAGPPYDKTTYMGLIRNRIDTADNKFAKASRDYRSDMGELQEIIAKWYSLANDAISMLDRGVSGFAVKKHLIDMRRAYIKGG